MPYLRPAQPFCLAGRSPPAQLAFQNNKRISSDQGCCQYLGLPAAALLGRRRRCSAAVTGSSSRRGNADATDSGDEFTGLGNSMSVDSSDGQVRRRGGQHPGLASRLAAWSSSITGRLLYQ